MDINAILNIVFLLIAAAAIVGMLFFRTKGNLAEIVCELVAMEEEQENLIGQEKMDDLIEVLYRNVPAVFRRILNKDQLREIAQSIFVWMRNYAKSYKERQETHPPGENVTHEEMDEIATDSLAELISEFATFSLKELKDVAERYGIVTDGITVKREIIRQIVQQLLQKQA